MERVLSAMARRKLERELFNHPDVNPISHVENNCVDCRKQHVDMWHVSRSLQLPNQNYFHDWLASITTTPKQLFEEILEALDQWVGEFQNRVKKQGKKPSHMVTYEGVGHLLRSRKKAVYKKLSANCADNNQNVLYWDTLMVGQLVEIINHY